MPADAKAVIVAPSIVGDRFVQLTPVYTGRRRRWPTARSSTTDQTAVPLELDQIYSSIDDLTVALGPNGANSNGALTDLLESTADELRRAGRAVQPDDQELRQAHRHPGQQQGGALRLRAQLEGFVGTLADNDETVRDFNDSLAEVSDAAGGRAPGARGGAEEPRRSASARSRPSSRTTATLLGTNIKGLNRVAKVLVKQRDALDEILEVAPLALNNLAMTYNPQAGTLDTNANIGELVNQIETDPALVLCGDLGQADEPGPAVRPDRAGAARAPAALGVGRPARHSVDARSTRPSAASWRWTER